MLPAAFSLPVSARDHHLHRWPPAGLSSPGLCSPGVTPSTRPISEAEDSRPLHPSANSSSVSPAKALFLTLAGACKHDRSWVGLSRCPSEPPKPSCLERPLLFDARPWERMLKSDSRVEQNVGKALFHQPLLTRAEPGIKLPVVLEMPASEMVAHVCGFHPGPHHITAGESSARKGPAGLTFVLERCSGSVSRWAGQGAAKVTTQSSIPPPPHPPEDYF